MSIQTDLMAEIDAFLRSSGMPETTFGLNAMNDGSMVSRIRNGRNVTIGTVERIRRYIAEELAVVPQPQDLDDADAA